MLTTLMPTHMLPKKMLIASIGCLSAAIITACSYSPNTVEPTGQTLASQFTQIEFIEQVNLSATELVIPYQKYQLANGLTVILHKDDSDPLVHVDVTYHVGSSREELGKSGFAHFFEHMMFQGSKNVADEQHFKIITESGGDLNGTTNSDRTNYYQTVPNNQLEKVLWLESDRMGFLLDAVTEKKFEIQRATVKNERGQNVDNRPYGRLNETVNQVIFPREHPYSWPTIGFMADLDRSNVNDLKAFFQRWYGPNNATLTIGGDIDITQTLAWVEKYFGEIPTGPEVKNLPYQEVRLPENRYVSMTDNVALPLIYISYPTVRAMHADEAPLDVLSNILGNGSTSILYKNLVKNGMAVQAGASHPCRELSCQMSFYALPNPQQGLALKDLEEIINKSLMEFEQRGINDDDLHKTKTYIENSTIYGLQSVSGKVSTLAFNQTFTGNPNLTQKEINRYQAVTKADVMRVYKKYIKDKAAAIISIVPPGQEAMIAQADNFTLPDITQVKVSEPEQAAITLNTSSFDRSVMPPAGKNPAVIIPEFWQTQFANGIEVIATKNSETPTISLTLNLEGGPLLEPIEKAGLASMTAQMMNESTVNYTKEELEHALEMLGSSINFSSGGRYTSVNVSSLTKNFPATMSLLADMLFNPAFDESNFERLKNQSIQGLQQQLKTPNTIAANGFKQLLYGENNRVGLPNSGTLATLSAITLDDVKGFYKKFYHPSQANLVVVGDIEQVELLQQVNFLRDWQGQEYLIPNHNDFPEEKSDVVYFIDHSNAPQSVIKIGRRAMPYDATGQHFRASLMNFPLGGNFNSRINLNLREDKGYTYGARTGFSAGKTLGQFAASASVKSAHTYDSVAEFYKEINNYRDNGITSDELSFLRSAISQNEALSYETPRQKAGFLRQLLQYKLDQDYGEQQTAIINSITVDEINAIAKAELSKPLQILIVGDGKIVKPQLEALNLPIVELKLAP